MQEETITIHRDELYKQVWEEPMVHLAPKYGLSDVGLRKICNKLRVPTPPVGYWVKISHGYKIPITPLPKLKFGEPNTYKLQPRRIDSDAEKILEDDDLIPEEIKSAKKIIVSKKLRNPHRLILETHAILTKEKPDDYGVLRPWRENYLNIRVAPNSLSRALRIMDSLIKTFEEFGFIISNDVYQVPRTHVHIFGEKLEFSLSEKTDRMDHKLTKKEIQELKRYPDTTYLRRWDYIPSGRLILSIDEWYNYRIRKKWSDSPYGRIEDILNQFLINIVKIAAIKQKESQKREEERRRWEEEQERLAEEARRKEIERQLLLDLENQSQLWIKSKQLRAYIQEVENAAKNRLSSENLNERLNKWLSWAKEHANQLDPLQRGLPFKMIQ